MTSWCGECGQPLAPVHGTATVRCCNGRMYWFEQPPLARDNIIAVRDTVVKGRHFWLYRWIPGGPP